VSPKPLTVFAEVGPVKRTPTLGVIAAAAAVAAKTIVMVAKISLRIVFEEASGLQKAR
jgi:hypothetical protein